LNLLEKWVGLGLSNFRFKWHEIGLNRLCLNPQDNRSVAASTWQIHRPCRAGAGGESLAPSSPSPQPATSPRDDDNVLFRGGRRWRIWRRGCPGLVAMGRWRRSWPEWMGSTSPAGVAAASRRYLAHPYPFVLIPHPGRRQVSRLPDRVQRHPRSLRWLLMQRSGDPLPAS
jgi:hypothetical protein